MCEVTHRLADVGTGLGDGLVGLVVKALWQRGRAVATLPGLEGQLVRHLKCLAQGQDNLVRQVLTRTHTHTHLIQLK